MPHLSETYSRTGILSRNATYRADARGTLKGTAIYDNVAAIFAAIVKRDAQSNQPALVGGLTQQQRVPLYQFEYTNPQVKRKNFQVGYIPYKNRAHHVVPVEVFYAEKWTAQHLKIVLQSKYNINNPENILYLPECHGKTYLCDYHNLPDHSKGHGKYNQRVLDECESIFDLVDKAIDEKDCEKKKDLRKQIYDQLKQIEKTNLSSLITRGKRPIG